MFFDFVVFSKLFITINPREKYIKENEAKMFLLLNERCDVRLEMFACFLIFKRKKIALKYVK